MKHYRKNGMLEGKPVYGCDKYIVYRNGKILSLKGKKPHFLKPHTDTHGYLVVTLWISNKVRIGKIHRLIGINYVGNPNNYPCLNHKDGNKLNNDINNLEWCTIKQNSDHAFRTGLIKHEAGKPRPLAWKPIYAIKNNVKYCFSGITEASKIFGVNQSCISKYVIGVRKKCMGYKWGYLFKNQNATL